jgi:hypothetical protein
MPAKWFEKSYALKRVKCQVPEDVVFATENQLLLDLIIKASESGNLKAKYVGVDSSFGRDHDFLDALPKNLIYFADVPNNLLIFTSRPELIIPEHSGRGRKPLLTTSFAPCSVKSLAEDSSIPWNDMVIGNGSQGPIIVKDKCIKVIEVRNNKPGKDVWLYIRMLDDGTVKYSLCNAPMNVDLSEIRKPALMRWSIEQCFRDCKQELGMGQYEVRKWQAWNRHILFAFIAYFFIAKLRRKFSINIDTPGQIPFVGAPVSLQEYIVAIKQNDQGLPITHPNIEAYPIGPQEILTI